MTITNEDGKVDLTKCINALSAELDSDIWLYSGPINDFGLSEVIASFSSVKNNKNALLVLVTNGGSASAAYQISTLFQNIYEKFFLFIPSYCKSAGTLIAVGADKLYMDVFSELGPLDVQLAKPNEIATDKSGLLSGSTFDALSEAAFETFEHFMLGIIGSSGGVIGFKVAAEISSTITTGLMSGIYNQINPDIVGSDFRDLNVAIQYGIRLADRRHNCTRSTILKLVKRYPSHDFIIDAEEAADLFSDVEEPTDLLYALVSVLEDIAYNEAPRPVVVNFTNTEEEDDDEAETEVQDGGLGNDEVAQGAERDRTSDPEPRRSATGEVSDDVRTDEKAPEQQNPEPGGGA